MQSINEKMKELRLAFEYTQSQLAIKMGTSRSLISLWEKGERKPSYDDIAKLSKIYGVSTDFLIGTTTVPDGEVININELKPMKNKVYVYGVIPAGEALEAIENIDSEIEIPTKIARKKDLFGLKIHGESMSKVLPNGSIAVFQKTCELKNGEIGAILVNGDDATVKRFHKLTNSIVLEPDSYNIDYKPIIIDADDSTPVTILGKLVWYCMDID